jgi:hypothetical protein
VREKGTEIKRNATMIKKTTNPPFQVPTNTIAPAAYSPPTSQRLFESDERMKNR